MNRYKEKIALVTASSTGIGFGISRRLAREGATVIISSRNAKNVEHAVQELKKEGLDAVGFPCHVGKKEQRDSLLKFITDTYGKLDLLVLNAAVSTTFGSLFITTESEFDKTIEINLKSVFFMAKEYHPIMPRGKI